MELTFIVTVDPVKPLTHLDFLVHAFNLQTQRTFDVVFFNQTLHRREDVFASLRVKPNFPFEWRDLDRKAFFGKYPLWDLYAFHAELLAENRLRPYFMSLHMEEFPAPDYVEAVSRVLDRRRVDILFGNLRRTTASPETAAPMLETRSAGELARYLERSGLRSSPHWSGRKVDRRGRLQSALNGYFVPDAYEHEDVFFMSVDFARRYNWYLRGHSMYFEDIHICQQPTTCELGPELKKITRFPAYFRRSAIYHLRHGKFYFQFEDREFSDGVLALSTEDPILRSLQQAIRDFRERKSNLSTALRYSRQNPDRMGTQDLNYRLHMRYLEGAHA